MTYLRAGDRDLVSGLGGPHVDPLPHWLRRRGQQLGKLTIPVSPAGNEAPPVRLQPADDDPRPRAVTAVHDCVGLHYRPPVSRHRFVRRGPPVHLRLQRSAPIRHPLSGPCRVHPGRVLAHHPAVGSHEPVRPRRLARTPHCLRDRVHRVVVAWPAEERQPTGHGQPARIIKSQPKPRTHVEHRHRETAVQIDRPQIPHPSTSHLQRMPGRQHRGRPGRQIRARHQVPLPQISVPVQEHPPLRRHAQPPRRRHRHQQDRRALVHLLPGHHVPRIRVGDHPVRRGHRDQLRRTPPDRRGRVRVTSRHRSERREQLAHQRRIRRTGQPQPGPPRVLDHRVLGRAPISPCAIRCAGARPSSPYPGPPGCPARSQ